MTTMTTVKVAGFKADGSDLVVPFTNTPLSAGWTQVTEWTDLDSTSFEQAQADSETSEAIEREADMIRDGLLAKLDGSMPVYAPVPKAKSYGGSELQGKFDQLVELLRGIVLGGSVRE
jgi:hypothetical protein